MSIHPKLSAGLLAAGAIALVALGGPPARALGVAYAPTRPAALDSIRARAEPGTARRGGRAARAPAAVPGYFSSRGLPPIPGHIRITDTGLVFRSTDGTRSTFPLAGRIRETGGGRWRASSISLAYVEETARRPVYVFRIDPGVFETEVPGALLEVAAQPVWLDSLGNTGWLSEKPLVDGSDSVALRRKTSEVARSAYADTLYALFGRPRAPVGLIGKRGRDIGRLGEYIKARDSLAIDPARIAGEAQLRHTLAHELAHRWQNRAPKQLARLWWGVPPIRDPKRYGYANVSEHQAEAIAFAVNFLQTTTQSRSTARSLKLLDHYELLVPGTRTMVGYLAFHPHYGAHPLRTLLTSRPTS